ncbi:YMGG-like glycine zipper-containing protein [uncultured Chryseobacterium sp.]|uniref:YMGG-like glycine zipper-containing protein n=1 Tax=uncultured Chryseobacterium sp. TaxID=259322 RepID=UPI0025FC7902|nr:YMGG-like glycine zipper-containing protein [uncultured Chryseobacterium sp.]
MRNIVLTGLMSVFFLTACKKDDQIAEQQSLEQQKMEFQMRQLEIEKQKLAIEKEKMAYEAQKKADSIAEMQKAKTAAAATARPQIIRETRTIYRDRSNSSSNSGTYANNGNLSQTTAKKKGMSEAAKGTIIGAVGGAALGAIVNKKSPGAGAAIGGVIGGATGYTLGRAQDRKSGRVQPR